MDNAKQHLQKKRMNQMKRKTPVEMEMVEMKELKAHMGRLQAKIISRQYRITL
jgi:hypothetical protein